MSLIINLSLTVIVATGAADAFVVNPPQGLTLFDELGLTPFGTFQVSSNADLNNFWSPHYWWKAVTENVNDFRFSPLSQSHATGSSNGPHRMTIRSEAVQPSHGAGEQAKLVETVTLEYGPDGRLLNVTRTIVRQVPVEPTSYGEGHLLPDEFLVLFKELCLEISVLSAFSYSS